MVYSLSLAAQRNLKLAPNFEAHEFRCRDGSDPIFVDEELVEILQKVRTYFSRPVNINSAYRTVAYNARPDVGGSTKSQHLYGRAADIWIAGISPQLLGAYIETLLPDRGGIGIYPPNSKRRGWVHVDVRAEKSRWEG